MSQNVSNKCTISRGFKAHSFIFKWELRIFFIPHSCSQRRDSFAAILFPIRIFSI